MHDVNYNSNSDNTLLDKPLTISEINQLLKAFIRERFYNICLVGEISSFRPSANGHWYFTLKDEKSQISAVMFRSANALCPFTPCDGDLVEVTGNLDVYEVRGTYQIIIQSMKHAGLGAILAQLQKKKEYYQSLGWFDPDGKPSLPLYPKNIGVITASTGAAIKDILDTTGRRAPSVDITIYPVLVQGESAPAMIAAAIKQANELSISDVLIVGRGGGSIEDLLPFSSDEVVKAVHESEIPVISAVGHEIDTSLCDYVATRRAITPTDAAVIATEGYYSLRESLRKTEKELREGMRMRLYRAAASIPSEAYISSLIARKTVAVHIPSPDALSRLLRAKADSALMRLGYAADSIADSIGAKTVQAEGKLKDTDDEMMRALKEKTASLFAELKECTLRLPLSLESIYLRKKSLLDAFSIPSMLQEIRLKYSRGQERIRFCADKNVLAMSGKYKEACSRFSAARAESEALSPVSVLSRGYAIVEKTDGTIVRNRKDVRADESVTIILEKDRLKAKIEGET